jgi:hypothetical protein
VTEDASDLTLEDVLRAAGEGLDWIIAVQGDTEASWVRNGTVFAAIAGERAEFRLDGPVVQAALRTPDTTPSSRGGNWVAFAPAILDDAAVDRAEAWFLSAARHAAK